MKLGASTTSPGVTARWYHYGNRDGRVLYLGSAERGGLGTIALRGGVWHCWTTKWLAPPFAKHRRRYQAKRAVEAAVSQALREAEQ